MVQIILTPVFRLCLCHHLLDKDTKWFKVQNGLAGGIRFTAAQMGRTPPVWIISVVGYGLWEGFAAYLAFRSVPLGYPIYLWGEFPDPNGSVFLRTRIRQNLLSETGFPPVPLTRFRKHADVLMLAKAPLQMVQKIAKSCTEIGSPE